MYHIVVIEWVRYESLCVYGSSSSSNVVVVVLVVDVSYSNT